MRPRRSCITVLLLTALTASARAETLTRDCRGNTYESRCSDADCGCQRWQIDWRAPDGSVWGASTGASARAVIAERDRAIALAKASSTLAGVEFDARYDAPSAPQCMQCNRVTRPGSPREQKLVALGALLAELGGKLESAATDFVRAAASLERQGASGRALAEYATALHDAEAQCAILEHRLGVARDTLSAPTQELERIAEGVRSSERNVVQRYARLPERVRRAMEARVQSAADGAACAAGSTLRRQAGATAGGLFCCTPQPGDFDYAFGSCAQAASSTAPNGACFTRACTYSRGSARNAPVAITSANQAAPTLAAAAASDCQILCQAQSAQCSREAQACDARCSSTLDAECGRASSICTTRATLYVIRQGVALTVGVQDPYYQTITQECRVEELACFARGRQQCAERCPAEVKRCDIDCDARCPATQ